MGSLLTTFGVSRLWLLETELWPAMLWACFATGMPVGIANARIEEKSFINYRTGVWDGCSRPLLRRLDVVLAQNETYAGRFRRLGVRPEAPACGGQHEGIVRVRRQPPSQKRSAVCAERCASPKTTS